MGRIAMENERLRLWVEPGLGAGISDLSLRGPDGAWWPLMRRAPERTRWFNDLACYLLAPWSNRIAGARFVFRGREHQVRADWPDGSAIHGLVKDRAWRIVERTPVTAMLEFESGEHEGLEYPWPFAASVRYELAEDGVAVQLAVRNRSEREAMPAGLGFHPFFERRLWDRGDRVRVKYAARGWYPAEGMIPVGEAREDEVTRGLREGRELGEIALDDVFLGSADRAEIAWDASGVHVSYECSAELGHGVVYTGEPGKVREFFCFEPVSMVNDGFNLTERGWRETGVVVLGPGEETGAEWAVKVVREP